MTLQSSFLIEMQKRGLIYQTSHIYDLDKTMTSPISAYIGFDPTADSLHVGSLQQLLILKLLKEHGHNPIALIGGATGKVGDPSFRSKARTMLSDETVAENVKSITKLIHRIVGPITVVNNADWTDRLSLTDYMQDIASSFSVNTMLSLSSIKDRLESGLSLLEFLYSTLQGMDFLHLFVNENVVLQIGGSDQWGNMTQGTELIRKKTDGQAFVLTTPLLTNSSGEKMGKTGSGTIWLDKEKTSIRDFSDFWMSVPDDDAIKFNRIFFGKEMTGNIYESKKDFVRNLCLFVHGQTKDKEEIPSIEVSHDQTKTLSDIAIASGFFKSKGNLRKMLENNEKVTINQILLSVSDMNKEINIGEYTVKRGKKSVKVNVK